MAWREGGSEGGRKGGGGGAAAGEKPFYITSAHKYTVGRMC